MNRQPIVIVAGEPNSIFLEIFFKSLKSYKYKSPLIIIVSRKLLNQQMNKLGYSFKVNSINANFIKFSELNNKKINIINVDYNFDNCFDNITIKSKSYINKCFNVALKILKKNKLTKLINGPISKKHFLQGRHFGITEYLADKTKINGKFAMLIFNRKLSVSPLTTHIALKDVSKKISQKKIHEHVLLITQFYKKRFNKTPKIAVTGLNPHCESNFKDSEEDLIIKPAIKKLSKLNYLVGGPYPADTIFAKDQLKRYDVIIGMYHDQVLSPVKTLFGFDAINITLGLPFIRVSPDHGPNSSMLGKNLSNPQSLIKALKFLDK